MEYQELCHGNILHNQENIFEAITIVLNATFVQLIPDVQSSWETSFTGMLSICWKLTGILEELEIWVSMMESFVWSSRSVAWRTGSKETLKIRTP